MPRRNDQRSLSQRARPSRAFQRWTGSTQPVGVAEAALEHPGEPRPLHRVVELVVERIDVRRQAALAARSRQRVLVGRQARSSGSSSSRSARRQREALARRPMWRRPAAAVGRPAPDRATAACRRRASSSAKAQRGSGSPGYHLPWPKCSRPPGAKRSRRRSISSPASCRLVGPVARRVPLGAVRVVDRDEGRLAAHGQAHVAGLQSLVDLLARRPGSRCHCSSV